MKKFFSIALLQLFLFGCFLNAPAHCTEAKKVGYLNITYEAKDSYVIKSKLFYPAKQESVYPVVVMLHSLGYSGDYWAPIVKPFVQEGVAVLLFDLRGHGASSYDSNFRIKSWRYFNKNMFAKYPEDVVDIMRHVASNYKNISTTKYAIIGADIGANTAIIAADKLVNRPSCMVLLSPTTDFKGLYTPLALADMGPVPILSMVSVTDNYSHKEAKYLERFAQGSYELKTYPSGGTGMLMLKANPGMAKDILDWVLPKIK